MEGADGVWRESGLDRSRGGQRDERSGGKARGGGRKGSAAREDRADETSKPEDRPSKLSHALSVLRKPRIGGWCVATEKVGRERKRVRGTKDDDRFVRKR